MKAYKVVKRCGDNTVISCGDICKYLRYTYRLDKENTPALKDSRFFVCKDLEDAKSFLDYYYPSSDLEIWQVKVKNLKKIDKVMNVWNGEQSPSRIIFFWEKHEVRVNSDLPSARYGSYSCASIKFIKKLKE